MKDSLIKAQKIRCLIGFFMLIPPFIGVIVLISDIVAVCRRMSMSSGWAIIRNYEWMWRNYAHGYDSKTMALTTFIYLILMALAGIYLIKGTMPFLLKRKRKQQ